MAQNSDSQGKPKRNQQWDDDEQWSYEREKISQKRRDRPRRRYLSDEESEREE